MNIASARFQELQKLVKNGEEKRPRTEAEEDQLALEDMIYLREGAVALARYRRQQRLKKSLKLSELSPQDRAIIERERENQKDFSPPPKSNVYAPRPKDGEDNGPSDNDVPIAWMRDH